MSHGSKFLLGLELELGDSWLIDTFYAVLISHYAAPGIIQMV